ncbi:MAG: DUF4296 domain-containing protein [Niabella sp.]|nr:DUF4296 domain-containing protein [Niabella sp.]
MILIVCFLLVSACGRPKGVLPQDQMEAVLWDVAKGSDFVNSNIYYRYPQLNRAAVNQEVLGKIFALHGVTKEAFFKSLDYYQQQPDVYIAMLDSIRSRQTRGQPAPRPNPSDSARAAQAPK